MDFDYGVENDQSRAKTRYNFDRIQRGASLHVATDAERCRVMAAFKYWSKKKAERRGAYASSKKVGAEDPKGPGFRIWFLSRAADAHRTAGMTEQVPQPNDEI